MFRNLKVLMMKNGYNNYQLAEKMDISPSSLSNKIKRKREFTINEIFKLLLIFQGATFEEIFLPQGIQNENLKHIITN